MRLEYIGHACFRLTLANGFAWVTDPYDGSIGLKRPAVSASVTTLSHGHFDHNCVDALDDAGTVLSSSGEYAYDGVHFKLIMCYHDEVKGAKRGGNLITVCEAEGMRICHMGDIGHQPDAALLEAIGPVDLLMLPVGGTYTLDGASAAEAVRAIGPRATVPMHFAVPGLKVNVSGPDEFLQAMGKWREADSTIDISRDTCGVILMKPAR